MLLRTIDGREPRRTQRGAASNAEPRTAGAAGNPRQRVAARPARRPRATARGPEGAQRTLRRPKQLGRVLFACVMAWTFGACAWGAETQLSPKLRAFRAARIISIEGAPVERGVLLVRGGVVEKVLGQGEELPAEAEAIDFAGGVILPGFVNPLSTVTQSANYRGGREGSLSAGVPGPGDARNVRAIDGLDPRSAVLRRMGRTGYAALAVTPRGAGFLAGLAGVARPKAAPTRQRATIREVSYLAISYGLGQRMRETAERELKKAAEAHKKARQEREKPAAKESEKAETAPPPAAKAEEPPKDGAPKAEGASKSAEKTPRPPPAPDPLVQAFAGEMTLVVRIDSAAAVDHFFRVLDGVPEPLMMVLALPPLEPLLWEKIAARRERILAVILEARLATLTDTSVLFNPVRIARGHGFEVALVPSADDIEGHERMLWSLAELVKTGVPEEAALRAVTAIPARLLGVQDRVGSLGPGREASFMVLDGDPFTAGARVLRVFVEGEEVLREDPASGALDGEAVR